MIKTDAATWAQETFGASELGDKRRTQRLVKVAGQLASDAGGSPSRACQGDEAAAEGAYRWLRNDKVDPQAVAEGGFGATVKAVEGLGELLALEDTTTLSYPHASAREQLGDLGGKAGSDRRGFFVHSVLLLERETGRTVGLIDQACWRRDGQKRGQRHARKSRPYEEKESAKWQHASERVAVRLGALMAQVISVGDREADVYEYLLYKHRAQQRYIVRASWNRRLSNQHEGLDEALAQAPLRGKKEVFIPQRGGRRSRTAQVELRSATVVLKAPARSAAEPLPALTVNAVLVQEVEPPEGVKPLRWLLLTSEPVDSEEAAAGIARDYGLRWRIEDFHKAWKTGAGVEQRRMQSAGNLERVAVVTAFIAVRLLQLRERLERWQRTPEQTEPRCDELLTRTEWRVLYATTTKKRPPKQAPGLEWAYRAIAKLGGWLNTKRTGRPSWKTLWDGWARLQERVEAAELANSLL
jgi:hypothetical protein